MATLTTTREKVKPARFARLGEPCRCNASRSLELHIGRDVFAYRLAVLRSEIGGRGFRLQKVAHQVEAGEPDHYDVLIDVKEPARCQCECRGWLRWGHCKHINALTAMVKGGAL